MGNTVPPLEAVTGAVALASPTSDTVLVTASATITTVAVKIIGANPNRKGLSLYNNSSNSVYLRLGGAGNGGTNMSFILATFNQISISQLFPGIVWTGEVWGIRNSGTGVVVATELL